MCPGDWPTIVVWYMNNIKEDTMQVVYSFWCPCVLDTNNMSQILAMAVKAHVCLKIMANGVTILSYARLFPFLP